MNLYLTKGVCYASEKTAHLGIAAGISQNRRVYVWRRVCDDSAHPTGNAWVVGRYIGDTALAAVGSSYTILTFLTSVIIGLCLGSSAFLSMAYGRRDLPAAGDALRGGSGERRTHNAPVQNNDTVQIQKNI